MPDHTRRGRTRRDRTRPDRSLRILGIAAFLAVTAGVHAIFAGQPAFDMASIPADHRVAVFAGGCFWCMEPPFDELEGVVATITGYTGGHLERPTYRMVAWTDTGHYEAVLVIYDPARVTYDELLHTYWINVNPVDATGQFCDRGPSYRSAIFTATTDQATRARASRERLRQSGWLDRYERPLATRVLPLATFWVAEDFHQDYYLRETFNYNYYRGKCGRDERLTDVWGAESERRQRIEQLLH